MHKKTVLHSAASAVITFVMFWALLFVLHVYPFGSRTLLVQDAANQYLSYLSYARYALTEHHGLFYTFSRGLGGDFYSFIAYYLSSPFNLLLLLGDRFSVPLIFTVIVCLKLSAMSFAYSLGAGRIFGVRWGNLPFAAAYAWIGYVAAYYWSIIWLDGLIAFPVIAAGLITVIRQKRISGMYCIGLIYAIVTNYYIGWMCALGTVLFFIAGILIAGSGKKGFPKIAACYTAGSLVSALCSAFVLIPSAYALKGGRASFHPEQFEIEANFRLTDLFPKFVSGALSGTEMVGHVPNVFCTSAVLILVILFFLDRRISLRAKLSVFGLLSSFVVSFHIKAINLIWHGFSENIGYPCRYSFIFSFLLILIANAVFLLIRDEGAPLRELAQAAGIYIIAVVVFSDKGSNLITVKDVYFSLFIAVMTVLAMILFCRNRKRERLLTIIVFLLVSVECMGNYYRSFLKLNDGEASMAIERNDRFLEVVLPAAQEWKESGGAFRMEVVSGRGANTPLFLDYHGISHYSSLDRSYVKDFLGRLGYRNNGNWVVYLGGETRSADSFLGIASVLSGETGVRVSGNRSVLPLIFLCSETAASFAGAPGESAYFDEGQPDENTGGRGNVFEAQNGIWRSIAGGSEDIFREVEVSEVSDNGTEITWSLTITDENPIYLYITTDKTVEGVDLYLNGERLSDYLGTYSWHAVSLGSFAPGDQAEVSLRFSGERPVDLFPFFYSENGALIDRYADAIKDRNTLEYYMIRDSRIEGSFTAEGNSSFVMTTIPYDGGWHLTVDGKKTDIGCLYGALVGADVAEGEHSFILRYIPQGLIAGCILSVIGLILLAALFAFRYR